MIPTQQHKYPTKSTQTQYTINQPICTAPQLLQKSFQISLYNLPISQLKDFHFAIGNTYICVDYNQDNQSKRVIHFCIQSKQCKILGQYIIKESQYILWMLDQGYVNFFQWTDKKPQGHIVQWNLKTHQSIVVNVNRQIMPLIKVFTFSQSQTFCICQHDSHMQPIDVTKPKQSQHRGKYHTKYKLSYYKFPLRKTHQKPHMVFKTHTNPKQYGFHQEIIKLNQHSMIGSISNKMDENDQTLLKTFDFRNMPMGIQINYKFHVQINYRKELLQLWVTDMWELRPENFYLKCQLRVDRAKQEKLCKQGAKINQIQNLQECIHLTWAYKNQNTIKFAKFKTPFLNSIQFFNGFSQKQRMKNVYNKVINKQKQLKVQPIYSPPQSPQISQLIQQPTQINQGLQISQVTQVNQLNSLSLNQNKNIHPNQKIQQIYPLTHSNQSVQLAQITHSNTLVQSITNHKISQNNNISNNLNINNNNNNIPTFTYQNSIHYLPNYFINNITQQIAIIDQKFAEYSVTFPAFYPTMMIYYRPINVNIVGKQNQKILQISIQKARQSYTWKQMQAFMVDKLVQDVQNDLMKKVIQMIGDASKVKDLQNGWNIVEPSKLYRQTKSRSNYQSKQYK